MNWTHYLTKTHGQRLMLNSNQRNRRARSKTMMTKMNLIFCSQRSLGLPKSKAVETAKLMILGTRLGEARKRTLQTMKRPWQRWVGDGIVDVRSGILNSTQVTPQLQLPF